MMTDVLIIVLIVLLVIFIILDNNAISHLEDQLFRMDRRNWQRLEMDNDHIVALAKALQELQQKIKAAEKIIGTEFKYDDPVQDEPVSHGE